MSNKTYVINPGPRVICDACNADWTIREESGGIYVDGWSICPDCAPEWIATAKETGEESHILRGPVGVAFSDWVRNTLRP